MTRSYRKNTLRTFKSTASRFAAVFAIVALGVGFLAGLNATPIDMKESMERYMDNGNFYDLRIVSTLGLTDEDVDALRQVEGVRQVQPGYSADLLVEVGGDTVVSRVHSLPAPENNTINQLNLVEGRLPEKSGECVIEASYTKKQSTYTVGTKLVVDKANEDLDTKLSTTEYTVVGIVHNANYFSFEREPASVGNGTVKLVFYIPQQDFAYEAYTEVYLTAEGALEQDSLGDAYQTNIDTVWPTSRPSPMPGVKPAMTASSLMPVPSWMTPGLSTTTPKRMPTNSWPTLPPNWLTANNSWRMARKRWMTASASMQTA